MSNATVIARNFTAEQSSAIAALEIDGNSVQVAFQSNPERTYTFTASPAFLSDLVDVVTAEDLKGRSMGTFISEGRRSGDLQEVAV
jgi:hypothetical protein